jgi:hypothetical protein
MMEGGEALTDCSKKASYTREGLDSRKKARKDFHAFAITGSHS